MNLLFVCTHGHARSTTAEILFRGHPLYSARACGIAPGAVRPITIPDITWANIIFTMETWHTELIRKQFTAKALQGRLLHCLNIPDTYSLMGVELITLLNERVIGYLEERRRQELEAQHVYHFQNTPEQKAE